MDVFSLNKSDLINDILFLLPGFLFIILFFYQIPDRRKSEFTTIVFSVLMSFIIDLYTFPLFLIINLFFNTHFIVQNDNVIFLSSKLMLAVFFSICIATFANSRLFKVICIKIFNVDAFPFGKVWNTFFKVHKITVIRVLLDNGICYIGKLDRASTDADDSVQELVLLDPFSFELKNEIPTVTRIVETSSVLLRSDTIKSIEKITPGEASKLYNNLL